MHLPNPKTTHPDLRLTTHASSCESQPESSSKPGAGARLRLARPRKRSWVGGIPLEAEQQNRNDVLLFGRMSSETLPQMLSNDGAGSWHKDAKTSRHMVMDLTLFGSNTARYARSRFQEEVANRNMASWNVTLTLRPLDDGGMSQTNKKLM